MNRAIALQPASSPLTQWKILSGPQTGMVHSVQGHQTIIGRGQDCDVVIGGDPKCSRQHARMTWTEQGYLIESLNETNPIIFKGQPQKKVHIRHGDVFVCGTTQIQFMAESRSPTASPPVRQVSELEVTRVANTASVTPLRHPSQAQAITPPPPISRPTTNPSTRLILYGSVAAFALFLIFGTSPSEKKEAPALRTGEAIEAEIEAVMKLKELAEESARTSGGQPSVSTRQAQETFVSAFRDYQKGQFERAIESFQACLSLVPDHPLCLRYLRLSQRKFNELIQKHIVLGRKYRDQNQFTACQSSFRNVLFMVKDMSSPLYKEAKANFDACRALSGERF